MKWAAIPASCMLMLLCFSCTTTTYNGLAWHDQDELWVAGDTRTAFWFFSTGGPWIKKCKTAGDKDAGTHELKCSEVPVIEAISMLDDDEIKNTILEDETLFSKCLSKTNCTDRVDMAIQVQINSDGGVDEATISSVKCPDVDFLACSTNVVKGISFPVFVGDTLTASVGIYINDTRPTISEQHISDTLMDHELKFVNCIKQAPCSGDVDLRLDLELNGNGSIKNVTINSQSCPYTDFLNCSAEIARSIQFDEFWQETISKSVIITIDGDYYKR